MGAWALQNPVVLQGVKQLHCSVSRYTSPLLASMAGSLDMFCLRNPEKGAFGNGALRKFVANCAPNLRKIAGISFCASEEGCAKLSQICRPDNFMQIPLFGRLFQCPFLRISDAHSRLTISIPEGDLDFLIIFVGREKKHIKTKTRKQDFHGIVPEFGQFWGGILFMCFSPP